MKRKKTVHTQHGILFIVIFCISLLATFGILVKTSKSSTAMLPIPKSPTPTPTPTPTPDPLRPKNVLLLGYGGGTHEGGDLTDTIIIAHVVPHEKQAFLITVPRDLWVPIQISEEASAAYKINEAYSIGENDKQYPEKDKKYKGNDGGIQMAQDVLQAVTGLPIDYTVVVSFKSFLSALKPLEPLSVDVPQAFTDPFYPIDGKEKESCGMSDDDIKNVTATMSGFELEKQFPCRYETLSYPKGKQTMDAETALKFVRSRHGDGDFGRSKRQTAVIAAVRNKLTSPDIITKLLPLATGIYKSIDTTISLTDIPTFLSLYSDFGTYHIVPVSLSLDNVLKEGIGTQRQYILLPKDEDMSFNSIKTYIADQIDSSKEATSTGKIKE